MASSVCPCGHHRRHYHHRLGCVCRWRGWQKAEGDFQGRCSSTWLLAGFGDRQERGICFQA